MYHHFPVHTFDSAPEASRPSLEALWSAFGFIPNIAGAMAISPVLIASLVGVFGQVHGGSFSEPQIQILLLTNAVTNASEWAVAFHSVLATKEGVTATDVEAVRAGRAPQEPKLAALSSLAKSLIATRGKPDATTIEAFLEVIAVSAASTMTNYTASVTKPPLEQDFAPQAWRPA
jgi:alkylhydroperoxidase family enzyme